MSHKALLSVFVAVLVILTGCSDSSARQLVTATQDTAEQAPTGLPIEPESLEWEDPYRTRYDARCEFEDNSESGSVVITETARSYFDDPFGDPALMSMAEVEQAVRGIDTEHVSVERFKHAGTDTTHTLAIEGQFERPLGGSREARVILPIDMAVDALKWRDLAEDLVFGVTRLGTDSVIGPMMVELPDGELRFTDPCSDGTYGPDLRAFLDYYMTLIDSPGGQLDAFATAAEDPKVGEHLDQFYCIQYGCEPEPDPVPFTAQPNRTRNTLDGELEGYDFEAAGYIFVDTLTLEVPESWGSGKSALDTGVTVCAWTPAGWAPCTPLAQGATVDMWVDPRADIELHWNLPNGSTHGPVLSIPGADVTQARSLPQLLIESDLNPQSITDIASAADQGRQTDLANAITIRLEYSN